MRTPIAATHSRPVQYLQDHAYRQEAPTPPPVPSSRRRRILSNVATPLIGKDASTMGYEFDGVVYDKLREMQEARRARYLGLVSGGMNFTRAAEAVGVSKRTGKVWRNGRGRSSGRDERALVDWYRGDMEEPKKIDGYYLAPSRP